MPWEISPNARLRVSIPLLIVPRMLQLGPWTVFSIRHQGWRIHQWKLCGHTVPYNPTSKKNWSWTPNHFFHFIDDKNLLINPARRLQNQPLGNTQKEKSKQMSPIRHLVEDFNSPTDLRVSRTPMNVRVLAQHLTLWTHEFTFQKTEVHKKPLWNEHVQWGKPWEDKASIKEEEKIERKDSASIIWWWLMVLRRAYSACHAILRTIQGFSCVWPTSVFQLRINYWKL